MNVSDQLVLMLKDAGVKRIYAITGDSLNPVNDAIRRDGEIEWIHVRHEEAAAYAASMDAELHGIGCCMGSSGPGHVHLVNGLYDANRAGNPVIAIASTVPTGKVGTDYFQETFPQFLFEGCSKYNQAANTPQQFVTMFQQAIQVAKNERGVAVVSLPGDVAAASYDEVVTSEHTYHPKPLYRPQDSELAELAAILNQNEKIAIYAGYGAKDAVGEVEALVEKLQAPLSFSFRGKIFFDKTESKYTCGMNGLLGNPGGFKSLHDADVVLMLGTDFPYAEFVPQDNILIQIDAKPSQIGRRGKVDHGYAGDIKDTVAALLPLVQPKDDYSFAEKYHKEYVREHAHHRDKVNKQTKTDHIHPEAVAVLLDDMADEDAIFTVDVGMTCVWAARLLSPKKGRYMTSSMNHGSMASALPQAIGAAASTKNRQVIALCGDGGLSMSLSELATVMQYQYPIKIVVFNNRSLGMVKLEMEVQGFVDWQTDMVNPPFEKVAELFNIKGYAVRERGELDSTMKEFLAHQGPALLHIYTDPGTLAMPPQVTFDQVKGFAKSAIRKVALGRFSDVGDMVKAGLDAL